MSARNETAFIIDDGDHESRALVRHFELLGPLVPPNSYYLVQATMFVT